MSWGFVAAGAATVIGGALSSSAAKSAAGEQADAANNASNASLEATRESNNLIQSQFNQNQQNQSPWLKAGGAALGALEGGLGLANPYAGTSYTGPNGQTITTGTTVNPNTGAVNTPAGAGSLTGDVGSATNPSFTNAAGDQVDANGNPVANTANPTNYGATAADMTSAYNSQQTNGVGNFTQTFAPSDLTLDPSYQFRLQQGQQALDADAAAKGLTGSGQNLKDITNYAQGAASQEYQAAYDRFMNTQNTQYNRLAGLAGVGQTTASGLGSQGSSAAQAEAGNTMSGTASSNNYLTSGAAAGAAGTVGQANAFNNTVGGLTNTWLGSQYLNKIGTNTPSTGNYNPSGDFVGPSASLAGP
jgi:hypothetical protein